jgi:putative ABC transport system permease protein
MAFYLALKEIWRNRGRFILFSLVIALITTLVLFIAALAGGLATANRQFIEKLDADLLVFQENTDLQTASSRLGPDKIREVPGGRRATPARLDSARPACCFQQAGTAGYCLIGVDPGRGEPSLLAGAGLRSSSGEEAVIDASSQLLPGCKPGDTMIIKDDPGRRRGIFELEVAGITRPAPVFLPAGGYRSHENLGRDRPQASLAGSFCRSQLPT